MSRLAAALCLVFAMMLTGSNVPIGKIVISEIPVPAFLVLRFAVASLALAVMVRAEDGLLLRDLNRHDWRDVAIMALVGSVLFMALMLEGTRRTAAADAGIITATIPATVTVLGILVWRRWPGPAEAAAVALACAGLAIMQGAVTGGTTSLLGNALVGLAVLCEAIFVLVSQRMSGRIRPIRLSLAVALASLLLTLPFAVGDIAATDWRAISPSVWALALWYALASSVLCTILWYMAAARVETWLAGLATAAMPITAVVVSALALGEPLGPARLAGAALVVAAIVAGALSQRRPPT
ncbi:MAG: DMT family transporter [Hyphomicrobiaceae bacterium]